MLTAVIVQARIGSTRLPGKVLKKLGRQTALHVCLNRCLKIPNVDLVVCAVPDDKSSDPLESVAKEVGVLVFRGPELDVLGRYHYAAQKFGADIVMRVTSDCPLLDPQVCGATIELLRETSADYACNNMPPLWPHGLDCEVFLAQHLAKAFLEAQTTYEREHVSPWIRQNPLFKRANLDGPGGGIEQFRWTLDYPEDLRFFEALWHILGDQATSAGYQKLIRTIMEHPELITLNSSVGDLRRSVPSPKQDWEAQIRRKFEDSDEGYFLRATPSPQQPGRKLNLP